MIISRSFDTPSGNTARKRTPRAAHAMANAIDVDPLDASTTVVPAWTRPVSTAAAQHVGRQPVLGRPARELVLELEPDRCSPDTESSSATVGVVASTSA